MTNTPSKTMQQFAAAKLPGGLRPVILDSWQRSSEAGVVRDASDYVLFTMATGRSSGAIGLSTSVQDARPAQFTAVSERNTASSVVEWHTKSSSVWLNVQPQPSRITLH